MITSTRGTTQAQAATPAAEPPPADRPRARGDRLVADGRVPCPRSSSGDVDVDACFGCDHLAGFTVDATGREWVRCSPPSSWVAWPRRPRG